MAGKISSSQHRRPPPPQATRFIVYRTVQGYWIASAKDGRVTGAFAVSPETARFALQLSQSGRAYSGRRRARAGLARRS